MIRVQLTNPFYLVYLQTHLLRVLLLLYSSYASSTSKSLQTATESKTTNSTSTLNITRNLMQYILKCPSVLSLKISWIFYPSPLTPHTTYQLPNSLSPVPSPETQSIGIP